MHPTPTIALPHNQWRTLSSVDIQLLETLGFLATSYRTRTHSRAAYCWPSRKWLAAKLNRSVRTISRRVSHLVATGLLHRTQRRQEAGKWLTNLYHLANRTSWLIAATRRKLTNYLTVGHKWPTSPPEEGASRSVNPLPSG